MQIQRISFSAPSFCKGQSFTPQTKEEQATYDTLYDYYVKSYSDCDPDYGDINDPTAIRNLVVSQKEIAQKAKADAKEDYDAHMCSGGSASDDFDFDRCIDVVV